MHKINPVQEFLMTPPKYFEGVIKHKLTQELIELDQPTAQQEFLHVMELVHENAQVTLLKPLENRPELVFLKEFAFFIDTKSVVLNQISDVKSATRLLQWISLNKLNTIDLDLCGFSTDELIWSSRGLLVGCKTPLDHLKVKKLKQLLPCPVLGLDYFCSIGSSIREVLFPINNETILIYQKALSSLSIEKLQEHFNDLIEINKEDFSNLAMDSILLNNKIIINKPSDSLIRNLKTIKDLEIIPINISEFPKTGRGPGSLVLEIKGYKP